MYLAIDFGTSTNYVVRWNKANRELEPISGLGDYGGKDIFDNSIYYGEKEILIGNVATKRKNSDPKNLVRYIKINIGNKNYSEFIPRLNKSVSAKEIAIDIFRNIKDKIEKKHGDEKIEGVVITVPFDYLHNARKEIKEASEEAGLRVLSLIEEPLAGAIRTETLSVKKNKKEKLVLVFDFGGGTLDLTFFRSSYIEDTNYVEVLNTEGNRSIGGRYIDQAILKRIKESCDFEIPNKDIDELLEKIKNVKELLEDEDSDDEEIFLELSNGDLIEFEINNEVLEDILKNNGFLESIDYLINKVTEDIAFKKDDIDEIVMVGGSSKLYIIKKYLKEKFGKEIDFLGEPDHLVGEGAAIYLGTIIENDNNLKYKIIESINHSIGIDNNGVFEKILVKNSRYGNESKKKEYYINNFNEEICTIDVYQGNSQLLKNCSKVGKIIFNKNNFKDQIAISFLVDNYGIINYKLYEVDNLLNYILIKEDILQ